MKLIRVIMLVSIWAGAAAGIGVYCIRPLRCNDVDSAVKQRTLILAGMNDAPIKVSRAARANLDRLGSCLQDCTNVSRLMIAAANERMLGRPTAAIAFYERAMQYDRRPELFLNLGMAQAEAGLREEAITNMFTACLFNPELLASIENLHDDVLLRVNAYQAHIVNLQRNIVR